MEKTFEMKKNDSAFIPKECRSLVIGLGWTCRGNIDLDASVLSLDANKKQVSLCNFTDKVEPGILHRGDNTTGEGSGDDERMRIDLD